MTTPPPITAMSKVAKKDPPGAKDCALKNWTAQNPIPGKDICRNWAVGKGECAKGQNSCKRAHAYPANTQKTEQQSFQAWVLARPN